MIKFQKSIVSFCTKIQLMNIDPSSLKPLHIDHLVYAVPNLEEGIWQIEQSLNARPKAGGRHPNWGTRNALLSLGNRVYLEVIGPDAQYLNFSGKRPFGIDQLVSPRLVSWAVRASNLDEICRLAQGYGFDLGEIQPGRRQLPDGSWLAWRLTDPPQDRLGGMLPFFIDWGASPHPSQSAPSGGKLGGLRVFHPQSQRLQGFLAAAGIAQPVESAGKPHLLAQIHTTGGLVELS
jgi:Glyoxalase-like domain